MDWLCDREMSIYQSAFGGGAGMQVRPARPCNTRMQPVRDPHALWRWHVSPAWNCIRASSIAVTSRQTSLDALTVVESTLRGSPLVVPPLLLHPAYSSGLRPHAQRRPRSGLAFRRQLGQQCLLIYALCHLTSRSSLSHPYRCRVTVVLLPLLSLTPPQVVSAAAADDRGAAEAAAHATRLDKFEQRFAWFRGRLAEKREVWGVFPEHWRVPQVRGLGSGAMEQGVTSESLELCVFALLPGA